MVEWIEPVFDRTLDDIEFAKKQIQEWIQNKLASGNVKTCELKGCFNVTDINRIEGNIRYITDKLNFWGYKTETECKTWELKDIPTVNDVNRILTNLRILVTAYHKKRNISDIPWNMINFRDINAIEENLFYINELIEIMIKSLQKCGMFKSGAKRILPIRR